LILNNQSKVDNNPVGRNKKKIVEKWMNQRLDSWVWWLTAVIPVTPEVKDCGSRPAQAER
jgi:hypothetical protein